MPNKQADEPKLPSGGEFSPTQVSLRKVLEIVAAHSGDRPAAEEEIRKQYFADSAQNRKDPIERLGQQRGRAGNVLIGMRTYGLYDAKALTPIGESLLAIKEDAELHEQFAAHVLRNRQGLTVLQAVRNIQRRGEEPTKGSISSELEHMGFKDVPRATTHHLVLLNWLRKGTVLTGDKGYEIDEGQVAKLSGVSLKAADEWAALTNPQRAVLRVLRNLAAVHGSDPQSAQQVTELVEIEYGRIFGPARDQLRKHVFDPLENGGWVTMSQSSGGRGGKSGTIAPTAKLIELDLDVLPAAVASEIPADLRAKLNTPIEKIYADLESPDSYTKGVALELLAIRIATDLNITPRQLRLRGIKTAGAEVDLVGDAAHLQFSRWLFQCKNTRSIEVADLAKEVGMCVLLRAHVIVMVTTGKVGSGVRGYAKTLAETTQYQAVLVDGKVLARFRKQGPRALLEFFHSAATQTLQLKRGQTEKIDELDDQSTDPVPQPPERQYKTKVIQC